MQGYNRILSEQYPVRKTEEADIVLFHLHSCVKSDFLILCQKCGIAEGNVYFVPYPAVFYDDHAL